ncbi:MAG: hypothetical protein ACM37Z_14150, partial [Deltaproteobacteria bacterium]
LASLQNSLNVGWIIYVCCKKKKGHKFSPMALFARICLEISHGADAASNAGATSTSLNQLFRSDAPSPRYCPIHNDGSRTWSDGKGAKI